jgi:hypothetical protein
MPLDTQRIYKRLTEAGVSEAECAALGVTSQKRSPLSRIGKYIFERPLLFGSAMILLFFVGMAWLVRTNTTLAVSAFVHPSEKPRQIEQYTIESPHGDITAIEIRSGTEFQRVLLLPDGAAVNTSGHVNSWGERQIDKIGR